MSKQTGGPAFAASGHPGQQFVQQEGMTLRDYFAAQAMMMQWHAFDQGYFESDEPSKDIAAGAYQMADAMIAERNK